MITPEQYAEIRRLYYGEHWKVGTIAAALRLTLGGVGKAQAGEHIVSSARDRLGPFHFRLAIVAS